METFTSKNFKILMIAVVILLGVRLKRRNIRVLKRVRHGIRTVAHGGDEYHRGRKGVFKFGRHVQRGA